MILRYGISWQQIYQCSVKIKYCNSKNCYQKIIPTCYGNKLMNRLMPKSSIVHNVISYLTFVAVTNLSLLILNCLILVCFVL